MNDDELDKYIGQDAVDIIQQAVMNDVRQADDARKAEDEARKAMRQERKQYTLSEITAKQLGIETPEEAQKRLDDELDAIEKASAEAAQRQREQEAADATPVGQFPEPVITTK